AAMLETAPPFAEISIDSTSLRHIDHACLNLLQTWQLQHEANHGKVHVDWDKMRGASYAARRARRTDSWWQKWLE
ncbi:MAG TPA: hypothetical protein VFM24_08835, partial [Nitrospira sp.]|nr:hypothetical protein [Nitrospira sp.]